MRHGPGLLRFEPVRQRPYGSMLPSAQEPRQRLRNVQPKAGTGSGSARPLRKANEVLRDPLRVGRLSRLIRFEGMQKMLQTLRHCGSGHSSAW